MGPDTFDGSRPYKGVIRSLLTRATSTETARGRRTRPQYRAASAARIPLREGYGGRGHCTATARGLACVVLIVITASCSSAQIPVSGPPAPTAVAATPTLPTPTETPSPTATAPVATAPPGPPPPSFAPIDLAFTTTGQGWVAGADCPPTTPGCTLEVRLTRNGGRTYERVSPVLGTLPPGSNGLPDLRVTFTDARTGWVTGMPRLLRSLDGGHSWHDDGLAWATDLTPLGKSVWALANGILYLSTDGGGHWSATGARVTPPPAYPFRQPPNLVRVSALEGFAVESPMVYGVVPAVLITVDGWRSWRRQKLPCRPNSAPALVAATSLSAIWVVCSAVAGAGSEGVEVDVSTDGGGTWQTRSTAEYRFAPNGSPVTTGNLGQFGYAGALTVRQDGRLFLMLDRRGVVESSDGATWSFVPGLPNEGADGLGVDFADSRHGWAAVGYGNPGPLWSTSDGGAHWVDLGPP